jgi:hypothetical protein
VITERLKGAKELAEYGAFLRALFSAPSEAEFKRRLTDFDAPPPFRVRLKAIFSRKPLIDLVTVSRADIDIEPLAPPFSFLITYHPPRKGSPVTAVAAILSTPEPNVSVLAAVCTRNGWRAVEALSRAHYPQAVPIFLSQREFLTTILALQRASMDWDFRVRGASSREYEAGMPIRSVREWGNEQLEQAREHIEERRQVIRSVMIAFLRRVGDRVDFFPSATCTATKTSEFHLSGRFALAWDLLVLRVASLGQQKLSNFSNRGMRERNFTSAPLAIQFRTAAFEDIARVRELAAALREYPHSMHATQHGNPYMHVRVTDNIDGSSFDVWAVTPNSIALIPGLKASEAAVSRLVNYISETFMEGEIVEYSAG